MLTLSQIKARMRSRKPPRYSNLDAVETVYLNRQLEKVKGRTYDIKFPQLRAREFIPVNNEMGSQGNVLVIETYDQVGYAKLIASYADDLPRADVRATQNTVMVKSSGNSYGYNLDEVRLSQATSSSLPDKKAAAARRAHEVLVDRIGAVGDSATGLLGLLNQPNAQIYTVPNGAGGFTTWATKTGAEIAADLIGLIEMIPTNSAELESANRVILPRAQYVKAASTVMSSTDPTKVLAFVKQLYPEIDFLSWARLTAAGSGGTNRMMAYRADPEYLEFIVPQEWEQLPVQERNLEYVVPCHGRIGGVVLYYPLSAAYGDGI